MKSFWRSSVTLIMVLATHAVMACDGPPLKGTPDEQQQQAFDKADVVFIAKIRKLTRTPRHEPYETIIEDAQLVVLEVFKGGLFVGQPVMVRNDLMGSCDLNLRNDPVWVESLAFVGDESRAAEVTDTWLIYASGREPWALRIDSTTISVNNAQFQLEFLRERLPRPSSRR